MDQSPVHLYDPITDYVSAELKRRYFKASANFLMILIESQVQRVLHT